MGELRVIGKPSLMDIAAQLRRLADVIEHEDPDRNIRTAVVVIGYPDGRVRVRAWGERTDSLQTTGWLHRALDLMTDGSSADSDERGPPLGPRAA